MDKETLIRLAQPLATFSLALSIISVPFLSVKAYNESTRVSGAVTTYQHHGSDSSNPLYVVICTSQNTYRKPYCK